MARTGISFTSGIGDLIVGGTQGSVLFIGPGGTLAQDNANFFWNDTLNILRLGSGTTTFTNTGSSGGVMSTMAAGNTFFIPFTGQNTSAGTTASTDIVLGNDLATDLTNYTDWGISSSTNADPLYTAFGAGFAYWYNQSGGMALGTANNFPVHIFSGGTLTANIRMTVLGTGNVGIGTTAPGFKLEVFGDMAVNNSANVNLRILRSSVEYGNIFNLLTGSAQGNNTDLNIRATNAAGGLNFMVGGSNTKMRLDFNGNLMIGTSPATDTIGSLLEVYTPNAGTTVTSFQNPTITVLNSDTTNNN